MNTSLINSEISILLIPHTRFNPDSWHLFDPFINYAVDIVGVSLASLINNNYLSVIAEINDELNLFGKSLIRRVNYQLQIKKRTAPDDTIGWLEESILNQFQFSDIKNLKKVLYEVFDFVFNGNTNFNNPGKALICEILKHQRLFIFESSQNFSLFSRYTQIDLHQNKLHEINPQIHKLEDFPLPPIELSKFRKIIKQQLIKFQNRD